MSKITVLMNSKKGRERTEGQDSTSSPNQLMVNFLPPQQGFWGNRSYRTAMFVFAVLGQNFLPIPTHGCSIHRVLSGLPWSVSLSPCENLTSYKACRGLGPCSLHLCVPAPSPDFNATQAYLIQSGTWQIFIGFTYSCGEWKENWWQKMGVLKSKPGTEKPFRIAYSANCIHSLALLKENGLFCNERKEERIYDLVFANQALQTFPLSSVNKGFCVVYIPHLCRPPECCRDPMCKWSQAVWAEEGTTPHDCRVQSRMGMDGTAWLETILAAMIHVLLQRELPCLLFLRF